MKQTTFILMCFLAGITLNAQTWTRTLSTSRPDNELGIVEVGDPAGSLINVSNVTVNGQSDVVVTRLFANGTINWTKKYSMTGGSEIANHFIVDRDSSIVVVGSVLQSGLQRGFVLKVGFTGSIIFASVTNSTNSNATLRKIIQMNSGYSNDYVVVGTVNYPNSNILARVNNSTGAAVWAHNHNVALGNTDLMYTLCQTNNNKIIVGGHFYNGTQNDHGVIQFNPANGARLRIQTYNIVNGTANNGGFDDATVIPGTDTVLFSMVLNGGGAASKHGLAVYNSGTNTMSAIRLNTIGTTNARATKIAFSPVSRHILMGGVSGVPLNNNFIHFVNGNTYATQWSSTFNSGFNRAAFGFNASWVSFTAANDVLVGNTLIPTGSFPTGNDLVIAKYELGTYNECFDSVRITDMTLNIPNPASPAIDSTNETIKSATFNGVDTAFNDTLRCHSSELLQSGSRSLLSQGTVFPLPFTDLSTSQMLSMTTYPNPASDVSSLELDIVNLLALHTTITVFDAQGRIVRSFMSDQQYIHIDMDLSSLADGIYVIRAGNKELTQIQKLIIN
jgi:hypothetical protein